MTAHPKPYASNIARPLQGNARIPGDKSISHRALMFGALAMGETIVAGLLEGEDVISTASALRAMGAKIERGGDGLWRINAAPEGLLRQPSQALDMGNSGTSTRLLMGVMAGYDLAVKITGDASLTKRPMKRVMTPLEQMGATFEATGGDRLPLTLHGTSNLKGITYDLPVASAQVKSAVLLAGLRAHGKTVVIEREATRDHTENMLRHFGAHVVIETIDGADHIEIIAPAGLMGCAIDVPGDPSSAAFPTVAAILQPGSEITLGQICMNPRRAGIYQTLIDMGADITLMNQRVSGGEKIAGLRVRGGEPLRGIDVPAERVPSMIDEFPILAVAASCATGTTRMTGLAELRVKESDRLSMMANGLKSCGVDLDMGEDSLTIRGTGKPPQGGARIETALDHRIAMSFLVLGTATQQPVSVDDISPVNTSFPGFVDLMNNLGADMEPA